MAGHHRDDSQRGRARHLSGDTHSRRAGQRSPDLQGFRARHSTNDIQRPYAGYNRSEPHATCARQRDDAIHSRDAGA